MRDFLERNGKLLRDHARKHRGMTLAGVLNVEAEQKLAVAERQHRGFDRRAAGMFEHAGNAEAAIFAVLLRVAAATLEISVIGKLERLVEHRREIAAVDRGADRGLVRHRRFFYQIAPPQLDRIDA